MIIFVEKELLLSITMMLLNISDYTKIVFILEIFIVFFHYFNKKEHHKT